MQALPALALLLRGASTRILALGAAGWAAIALAAFAAALAGLPQKDRTIEELAKQHTPAAIAALVEALDGKDRVAAAALLLAYAYGKPRQHIKHSGEVAHRYVVRAPSPVQSAAEWIARHAPKDTEPV